MGISSEEALKSLKLTHLTPHTFTRYLEFLRDSRTIHMSTSNVDPLRSPLIWVLSQRFDCCRPSPIFHRCIWSWYNPRAQSGRRHRWRRTRSLQTPLWIVPEAILFRCLSEGPNKWRPWKVWDDCNQDTRPRPDHPDWFKHRIYRNSLTLVKHCTEWITANCIL